MKELLTAIGILAFVAALLFVTLIQAGVPHSIAMPGVTIPMGLVPTLSQTFRERNRVAATRAGTRPIDDLRSFGIHPALVALYSFLMFVTITNLAIVLSVANDESDSSQNSLFI